MSDRKRAEEVAREIAFKLLYPIITLPEYDNAYDEPTNEVLDLLLQFSKEESERAVKEYSPSIRLYTKQKDRISELELKLRAMTKSAESQCKMREELEAENAELQEANKRMRPIGEFVMSDYVDPELRERDEEIKRLEAENAELKKSAEKQSAWIEDHWYVEANYPIDKAYSNALKKIKRLEAKLENCKTNHSNWDKALNQKQDRIEELEAENAELKKKLEIATKSCWEEK